MFIHTHIYIYIYVYIHVTFYTYICMYFHYHHFPNLRGNSKCTYIHRFDGRCEFARVESGILSAKSLTGFELYYTFFLR